MNKIFFALIFLIQLPAHAMEITCAFLNVVINNSDETLQVPTKKINTQKPKKPEVIIKKIPLTAKSLNDVMAKVHTLMTPTKGVVEPLSERTFLDKESARNAFSKYDFDREASLSLLQFSRPASNDINEPQRSHFKNVICAETALCLLSKMDPTKLKHAPSDLTTLRRAVDTISKHQTERIIIGHSEPFMLDEQSIEQFKELRDLLENIE